MRPFRWLRLLMADVRQAFQPDWRRVRLESLTYAAVAALAMSFVPGNTVQASGLLIPAGGNRSLAIQSQRVQVSINNGVAVTTVTQVFKNDSAQPLEALYT